MARGPGRPKKHIGLATPSNLKRVFDGTDVRDLREADPKPEGQVLPPAREAEAPAATPLRVFGTASDESPQTVSPGEPEPAELDINALLRRIVAEPAARGLQDDPSRPMSNLELMLRRVVTEATNITLNSHKAREFVIDRLVGKAGRAATPQGTNTELDGELDRAAFAMLNELATPKKDSDV